MNIWALRKKLASTNNIDAPAPELPAPVLVAEVTSAATLEIPAAVGLNDLFEMTDSQLHQMSPKNTFSMLKNFPGRTVNSAVAAFPAAAEGQTTAPLQRNSVSISFDRSALRAKVGLDELLTMDAEKIELLFD